MNAKISSKNLSSLTRGLVQIKSRGPLSHPRPAVPPDASTLKNSSHVHALLPRPLHRSRRAARGARDPAPCHWPGGGGAWPPWRARASQRFPPLQSAVGASLGHRGGVRIGSAAWTLRTRQKQQQRLRQVCRASSCDPGAWGGALEATPSSAPAPASPQV